MEVKRGVFLSLLFIRRALLIPAACLLLMSCAGSNHHIGEPTMPFSDLERLLTSGELSDEHAAARMQCKTIQGVTVTAAVLPDEEARERYGADLGAKGLQAIWMRIENRTATEQWMLATHLDPDHYTADEAAFLFRHRLGGLGHEELKQRFRDLAMRARLEPGSRHEGHVLVPRSEGGRYVEITTNGQG